MARRFKLTKYELTDVNYHWLGTYRIRLEVSDAEGMEPYVFLYRRGLPNPATGEPIDKFMAVCSPVDMETYPPLEPDGDLPYPFFRLDYVELDVQTVGLGQQLYDSIVRELTYLKQALDRLDLLRLADTLWIGGEPESSDSESSSTSGSSSAAP